jgi:GMP synthase (glutamine-hydrolysing)
MVLRAEQFQSVLDQYEGMGLNVKGVDASQRFYDALAGVTDPELKRKAIGNAFIEVLIAPDRRCNLLLGTIYPMLLSQYL